jgi:hypothetical protein
MPHAGLMDERSLGPDEGPRQRARLHIRGGRRRLQQGKIASGIVTLYDAMLAAMQSFAASPGRTRLDNRDGEDLNNDSVLYTVLVRSGILDGKFDFSAFDRLTEKALNEEMPGFDYHSLLVDIESVMTQLGILPFDEMQLPPEDPKTF